MLLFFALCALLLGRLLGGRLSRFEGAGLRWLPLPALALLCQAALGRVPVPAAMPWLISLSYLLLLLFVWKNRHLTAAACFIGLGSLCNYVVIAANGFRMPVSPDAMSALSPEGAAALLAGEIPMYAAAGSATRLLFLGDLFWFPLPPFQGFASVGDLLLSVGVFFLLMALMAPVKWFGRRAGKPADP